MTLTKTQKKQKKNQQALKLKMRVAAGNYSGMYYYAANAGMSTTKDAVATRPMVVVTSDPQKGHLVVPLSTKPLLEVHHQEINLPNTDKLSWLAPNEAMWVQQINLKNLKHLPQAEWVKVQINLRLITAECSKNKAIDDSLKGWLNKATHN